VDTKLPAPAAGRPLDARRRRLLLAGALAGLSPALRAGSPAVLIPGPVHVGARLLQRVSPTGMPEARPDTFGPMTLFVFPTAVAATPFDLYIVDPGLGALLRYDPALDAMAPVRGARVSPQSRIAALPDGSVALANGGALPVQRFARGGRQIQTVDPQLGSAPYDDIVADPSSGRFYGLDRVQGRLEETMPQGRGGVVLPPGLLPDLPVALAMDDRRLYAAGRVCACVEAIDLFGSRSKEVVAEALPQVIALAAGGGWLAINEGSERLLRLYRDGLLRVERHHSDLQLVNPQGMALANGTLYVADAGARRIATFRLRP